MLKNPYPFNPNAENPEARRLQTDISAEDKALLFGLWPVKGTVQQIVNNLIFNLCNDLRDLTITSYRPDAPDILGILVERRSLSVDQLERISERLRRTSAGFSAKVPPWVQHDQRGPEVRSGATATPASSSDPTRPTDVGKQRTRKAKPKAEDSSQTEGKQ